MPPSNAAANFRKWARALMTSLPAMSPPVTPAARSEASISASVVSRVLPSTVTVRRPGISRLAASGIRGIARRPMPLAAARNARRAALGLPMS